MPPSWRTLPPPTISAPGSFRGAWAPTTAYKARDLIIAPTSAPAKMRGRLLSANVDFTSGASFSATNWTVAEHDESFAGPWQPSTAYTAGQVVSYLGALYSATADFTSAATFNAANWTPLGSAGSGSGLTWRGPWVSGMVVAANDVVIDDGSSYRATVAIASSTIHPATDTASWALLAAKGDPGSTGPAGTGPGTGGPVSADGILYVSTNTGNDANDGLVWATAKKTIQAAINAASSGSEIRVAAGIYTESITMTINSTRIIGINSYPGAAGVRIQPAADDSTIVTFENCQNCVLENVQLRNQSRAGWRGVFVHNDSSLYTKLRNVKFFNVTSTCPITGGSLGGTGVLLTQGEGFTLVDCDFNAVHLAVHVGREASLPFVENCNNIGCYRQLVCDNDFGPIIDDMTNYASWAFLSGSTAVMNSDGTQLAALSAASAQTVRVNEKGITFGPWLPSNQRQSGKITVGGAGSFGFTARSKVIQTTISGAQNPANGGTYTLASTAGMPTSGIMFSDGNDVVSYSGIVGNVLQNVQRNQGGTTGGANRTSGTIVFVPTGDALVGRYNAAAQALEICTIRSGTIAVLASQALALASGTVRYLDFEAEDDTLTLKAFTTDPRNPGDPFWLVGTAVASVSTVLAGADKTDLGAGVVGLPGHRADFGDTAWLIDDTRIRVYGGVPGAGMSVVRWKATGGVQTKRRDGTNLSASVAPVHRSEYDTWTMPGGSAGVRSNTYLMLDMTEGTASTWSYWGDTGSKFIQCTFGNNEVVATTSCTFDHLNGQVSQLTGNDNKFLAPAMSKFTDLGLGNVVELPNWSPVQPWALPSAVVYAASTDHHVRTRAMPRAAHRIGGEYGHAFGEGAASDVLVSGAAGAVNNNNGWLVPIYTGGVVFWDQLRLEVISTTATGGNIGFGIYALDPLTLLPMDSTALRGGSSALLYNVGNISVMTANTNGSTVTFGTPLRTSTPWIGVLVFFQTLSGGGGSGVASVRGIRSGKTSPAPYGFGPLNGVAQAFDAAPPIFPVFNINVPSGAAPSVPVFSGNYSDIGPQVRLRRSA